MRHYQDLNILAAAAQTNSLKAEFAVLIQAEAER